MPYATWSIILLSLVMHVLANHQALYLWPLGSARFEWWQPLTYQFQHGGWLHLLVNALALLSFGPRVERWAGRARFACYYLACGLAGGFLQLAAQPGGPLVGASAGVFGIFAIYSMQNHDGKVITPLLVPMPAWLVLALYAALSVICWWQGWLPMIAHAAHLGGIVMGLALGHTAKSPDHR